MRRAFFYYRVPRARNANTLRRRGANLGPDRCDSNSHGASPHACTWMKCGQSQENDSCRHHQPKRVKNQNVRTATHDTKCRRNMQTQAHATSWDHAQDEVKGSCLEALFASFQASGPHLRGRDPQATMTLCLGTSVPCSVWKYMLRVDLSTATCSRQASHRRRTLVTCVNRTTFHQFLRRRSSDPRCGFQPAVLVKKEAQLSGDLHLPLRT